MTETSPEDERLVRLVHEAKAGDEHAFSRLYLELQPRLLRYLRTLVGEDAEDVASEAWLQVARDLRGFTGDAGGFRGWTVAVARNRALDHLRHTRRRPAFPTPVERLVELAGADDTAQAMIDVAATDAAVDLVSRLPREQAEAVMLRVVFGLDAESAGKVLGKRAGAVRMAAHRGLRGLAAMIDDSARPGVTSPPSATLEDTK